MQPRKVTIEIGEDVADIPTMREMPNDGYSNYVSADLFFVDHHDVLRAVHGEYPIATTAHQVEVLINYLQTVASRMRESDA